MLWIEHFCVLGVIELIDFGTIEMLIETDGWGWWWEGSSIGWRFLEHQADRRRLMWTTFDRREIVSSRSAQS